MSKSVQEPGTDVGSARHRLAGSVAFRLGTPQDLGSGHFFDMSVLAGLGWRYGSPDLLIRGEVRTGSILVLGYGFGTNRGIWLPWVEFQLLSLWRVGGWLVGPQVSVSPLRHEVVTAGRQSVGRIPWLRIGVAIGLPLWEKNF